MAIGPWQIAIIVLIVVLLFGAGRLSEIGKGLGEGIKNFKKGISGDDDDKEEKVADKKEPKQLPPKRGSLEESEEDAKPAKPAKKDEES
jgi:sec-independent protein translocase protein TatA